MHRFWDVVPAHLDRLQETAKLMRRFAERTGLITGRNERRYLWTDAFAVCNFLELGSTTGRDEYTGLGLRLIDRVHETLGKHRADDARTGWLSGLIDAEAKQHPTLGGLRIGKPLPERGPDAPYEEPLEWERDGQYFHYLSKWMHALDQTSRRSGDPVYNLWARELAQTAYQAFARPRASSEPTRMVWKMSIDLSRTLVPSMGQHDPLDGFITCVELESTMASLTAARPAGPSLGMATRSFARMAASGSWLTTDPLGLGGLLMDACRVAQLMPQEVFAGDALLQTLLKTALEGLSHHRGEEELSRPASQRLAFRELGLGIGLHGIGIIAARAAAHPEHFRRPAALDALLGELQPYVNLAETIQSFWMRPSSQKSSTWLGHLDINEVMLASSLAPEGVLCL